METGEDRSQIVFFDIETTIQKGTRQKCALLEFGAILVCPKKLVEQENYSTLVRPQDLSLISELPARRNGINKDDVISAPAFADIADKVFDILHGRIWAGHNILEHDCPIIWQAFADINRPAPEPKGTIDTFLLLRQTFGRRAGDMKMASLANYFDLGEQTHRSLADVRKNLEVVKCCATVLFLESSLPNTVTESKWVSSSVKRENCMESIELLDVLEANSSMPMEEEPGSDSPEPSTLTATGAYIGCTNFLEASEISISSVSIRPAPSYRESKKVQILHNNAELQVCSGCLKVKFGISTKFLPRLSFVVYASSDLCQILATIDNRARKVSADSGSTSKWSPVVCRKYGFMNPTIRLHLQTVVDGNTEIYQKDTSTTRKLMFSRFDEAELGSLFTLGTLLDAYFSVDSYDYQRTAGIRLVAKKLVVSSS